MSTLGVVQARRPGKATIKVLSIHDSLNYDEVGSLYSYVLIQFDFCSYLRKLSYGFVSSSIIFCR